MMKLFSKLGIGTVQFGLDYGVANSSGQTSEHEVREIMNFSLQNHIDTLDTAIAYGQSERVLGDVGIDHWKVVTKLPNYPNDCIDVDEWVNEQFSQSLTRLKQKRVYALLLHRPSDLLTNYGETLYKCLSDLKSNGLIEKLGVSVYSPSELSPILDRFDVDLVQAPVNIFDRSFEISGLGEKLKESGIEFHARSIFLQGLLLMKAESRPEKFSKWNKSFEAFDKWLAINNKTALEAALKYVDQLSFVDKLIVGVNSKVNLEQILAALGSSCGDIPVFYDYEDLRLITPSRWSEL